MGFKKWLSQRYLHTVGFMSGSETTVVQVMLDGKLKSTSGLIFLRPASFLGMLEPATRPETLWITLDRKPNLLVVDGRSELMSHLHLSGHTDNPAVARQVAEKLKEAGYDGFERKDFPEVAILAEFPHHISGRVEGAFYLRDGKGKIRKVE